MESAGDIIKKVGQRQDTVSKLIRISTRKFRKIEAIEAVRRDRDDGCQELAYNARPFVLCGLPLRRPPKDQLNYIRTNGRLFLEITAHPIVGLPYGQDRLIPIWTATLAVQQQSRVVRFNNPSQVLDYFELPKNGHHYRRIIQGFERIFAATIFFGTNQERQRQIVSDWARFHFFDKMQLWYNRDEGQQPLPGDDFSNIIHLSEAFYREIDEHRIPVERRVVAALANAPGTLDLYIWLVWKSWTLRLDRRATIPILGEGGMTQQLGCQVYGRDRAFREKLSKWLAEVKAWWPECPAVISDDGRSLIVSSAKRSPAIRAVVKPANS